MGLNRPKTSKTVAKARDDIGQSASWTNALSNFFSKLTTTVKDILPFVPGGLIEFLKSIPLATFFIHSVMLFHQGIEAYRQPVGSPQRLTKIASGIAGGVIASGLAILATLVLVGAVMAAPFVIPALTIGIYAVALYRDYYSYTQTKLQLRQALDKLDNKNYEIQGLVCAA